jgi:uncharacterized Zn-binding protein involved in type VI secretion
VSEPDNTAGGGEGSSEKDGEWGFAPSAKSEREFKAGAQEHKLGRGDRDPNRKPDKPAEPEGAKTSFAVANAYEQRLAEGSLGTTQDGKDDETYASALSGSASLEALGGSLDTKKLKAKLTVVELKAHGNVAHAQVDVIDALKHWLSHETPAPPSGPMTPMAARLLDLTAHGTPLAPGPGSANVFIGSMPALRANIDMFACMAPGAAPHGAGPAQLGEPTVYINSMPAVRVGDFVAEPGGGPNLIVSGCATVMIGSPAGPPPAPPKPPEDEAPWVIFESVAKADVGDANAEADVEAEGDLKKGKGSASIKLGASAALAKAELPLKVRLRIPFTSAYLGLGVTAGGTLGSVGGELGASVKVNEIDEATGKKKWFAGSAGAGAHAGLGGVSVKFSVDVSEK